MRSKFTLLLLALNLALFGYLALTERWITPDKVEENRRRILGPEAADLSVIEIAVLPPPAEGANASASPAPAHTLRLERQPGDGWFLAAPLDWPANDFAVRLILNQLQFLENETSFLVTDLARNGQTLADYGLSQPRIVVTCTPSAKPAHDSDTPAPKPFVLKIGATAAVGDRLYILSPDERRIHVASPKASANLLDALTLDLGRLRSDQLFTIPVFEARALTLQSGAANSSRTRLRREQSRWTFEAPITARAAKTPVELAVNDLNALRVARFLAAEAAPTPEAAGLVNPRLRVTLEGNARRETLLLGAPVPGGTGVPPVDGGASPVPSPGTPNPGSVSSPAATVELYARLDWRVVPTAADNKRPVLFTVQVPVELLKTFERAQTALRDKRVLDLDPARVTAFALSSPGKPDLRIQKLDSASAFPAWQIASPAAAAPLRADAKLVEHLLQRLQLLEAVPPRPDASPFVFDAPSAADLERLGFNRPERIVTLQLSSAPSSAGGGPSSASNELVLELAQPVVAGPDLYARVAGQPFVYAVPSETLDQIPVSPLLYRDRTLARLPETTKITRLVLRRAGDPDAAPLLDHAVGAEPPPAPVATLLSALRELRAKSINSESYPATVPVDGVEKPWAYTLEATLDPAPASGPLRLSFAERSGSSTQLAGSETLGLVFTLEQPVLDALWQLLYREPKP